jgi:uncharacterized protein (TIGR03437 family)
MSVPLSFEPNQGQAASTVQFVSRGSGYALFLTPGAVVLNLERPHQAPAGGKAPTPGAASIETLRMGLIGANPNARAEGLAPQPGVVSYFIGNDPAKWRTGIPTYGKVNYAQVYPGVDLVFYGNQRQLEYDFVVAPGADASHIAWRIAGARAGVDADGNLKLRTPNGPAGFKRPVVYQLDGDTKTSVEASFAVAGNEIRFRLGRYDHSKTLIIDPVLTYASYLAGSGTDHIGQTTGPGVSTPGSSQGIAIDSAGSAYVTGDTFSLDFPITPKAYLGAPPTKTTGVPPGEWPSVFVTKFSADGSSLVYSTYLGGEGSDYAFGIAVDSGGNAYITGQTNSVGFPVTSGAYQTVCDPAPSNASPPAGTASCNSANVSAYVTKLNPTGTGIVYSTFLGGYAYQYATAIAVDSAGRAYIAGNEEVPCSTGYVYQFCFPTTSGAVINGNQTFGGDPQFAFVAAFDPTGAHLLYSTILGDTNFKCVGGCGGDTYGTGVAVDANGYFYLVGETRAASLPTTAGVYQPNAVPLNTGATSLQSFRGFIAKFTPVTSASGASLAYATYLGGQTGNTGDYISGIAIDSSSNAYVVGYTNSTDFPVTAGAFGTVCGPGGQTCAAAHVTKLNPTGTKIVWSTYVGDALGDGTDAFFFTGPIQLDGSGNVYIIGQSGGPGFPTVNPVEPTPAGGSQEILVAELDPTGTNLLFATRIGSGGIHTVNPAGLAVDSAGHIYVAGNIIGQGLITTPGAFQPASNDSAGCCYHGAVAKITPDETPGLESGTVANGATYIAGGLVPGSWAQVKGVHLSPTTRIWLESDFTGLGINLPTNLSGVQVTVNSQPAAIYYISPNQISFQVPAGISGAASVQVINNGQTTGVITGAAAASSPGIFPLIMDGVNYAAGVFYSDGKIVGDPANGAVFRNAVAGDTIELYATGLAASPAGTLVSVTPVSGVTVTLGSTIITPISADLVAPGEFQVNFTVPQTFASLASGLYQVSISVNGVISPVAINSSPPGPVVIPVGH